MHSTRNVNKCNTTSTSKQALAVGAVILSQLVRVDAFGAVRTSAVHLSINHCAQRTQTELYYLPNGKSNGDRSGGNGHLGVSSVGQGIFGGWFNELLKSKPEKDDFEKYVEFLGNRYSRLHFEGEQPTHMMEKLGLKDVHTQRKAKQGIMAFNFKEASTFLEKDLPEPTGKKVGQVIYNSREVANMSSGLVAASVIGTRLAIISSVLLKQIQAVRVYVNAAIKHVELALSKTLAFILGPISRDTPRRVQVAMSLTVACALLMYKPLKGVAFAVASLYQDA